MREIRRRTRVVGAFPDGNSALMLVAAASYYLYSNTQANLERQSIASQTSNGVWVVSS